MARYNGKSGTMLIDGTQIHITEWNITEEVSVSDSTDSESGDYEKHTIGRKKWSGSFKGFCDDTTVPETIAQVADSAVVKLTTNGTKFYQGTATITSLQTTVPIGGGGGTVEFSGNFQGNGTLTRPV